MKSASQPRRSFAMWKQSSSQLEPGKTTIPNFTTPLSSGAPSRHDPHVESLDHRVGEELLGHLLRVGLGRAGVLAGHVDEEDLAGAHVAHAAVAQPPEGGRDGLALRIENARLGVDPDFHFHASKASRPWTWSAIENGTFHPDRSTSRVSMARTISGVLLVRDRCVATMRLTRGPMARNIAPADWAFERWPNPPEIRFFKGQVYGPSRSMSSSWFISTMSVVAWRRKSTKGSSARPRSDAMTIRAPSADSKA